MRAIVAGVKAGDEACQLAFEAYSHRLAASVAAMAASLGGLDSLVFTGGVGRARAERSGGSLPPTRFLGLGIDAAENDAADRDALISPPSADATVAVVRAREELQIAAATRTVMS